MDLDFVSVHKHAIKLGQYPAILTSRLVNNPYILCSFQMRFCEKFTTPLNSMATTTTVIISTPQIVLEHGAAARSWLAPEARTVMELIIVILRITATITVT